MLLSAATERDERARESQLHSQSQQPQKHQNVRGKRGSRLLTHREEKGIVEAPMKKILIWRAEDLTPEGST